MLEALIKSGAMDCLHSSRAGLFASIDKALKLADKAQSDLAKGQADLFGEDNEDEAYQAVKDWVLIQTLDNERETLGLYFSGHPVQQYQDEMNALFKTRIQSLSPSQHKSATIVGLVTGVRRIITKRGKKMAIVSLDDSAGLAGSEHIRKSCGVDLG